MKSRYCVLKLVDFQISISVRLVILHCRDELCDQSDESCHCIEGWEMGGEHEKISWINEATLCSGTGVCFGICPMPKI